MKRTTIAISIALILGTTATLILLWLLGGGFPTAQAQGPDGYDTYHVALDGNCGGMIPCYTTVQAAVDDADDPGDVVKVAAGIYTGVQGRSAPPGYSGPSVITQVVYISKTLSVRGGYTTTNWTVSDPDVNSTVLDALGQGRVVFIAGDIGPTIEGLRITGGDAAGLGGIEGWKSDLGGGVYIVTATAAIRNNRIYSNTAGGLLLLSSDASLDWNTIFSNTASLGGGACLYESDATLAGNTISSNVSTAYGGGGLYLYESEATLIGNIISSNTDEYNGGGGVFLASSNAMLSGNTVSSNTTWSFGGGLYLYESEATLNGNTISFNRARYNDGGGLYIQRRSATLVGNTISHNVAGQGGGGVYLEISDATLGGNIVSSNTAGYGGGLYLFLSDATLNNNDVTDNQITDEGSGLFVYGSRPHLLHTTIARNSGGDGSGVHVSRVVVSPGGDSVVMMTNTILVSHTVGIYVGEGSTATLESTLWQGNNSDWSGSGTISVGTHNYWGDPAFVDPDNGNYHIGSGSAAIDVGIAAGIRIDIDREPRSGIPDLGADEYWAPGALKRIYLPLVLRQYP